MMNDNNQYLFQQQYVIIIRTHAIERYIERFEPNINEVLAKKKLKEYAGVSRIFARHNLVQRNDEVALCNEDNPEVVLIAKEMGRYMYIITCEEYSRPVLNWWEKEINHETFKKDII